MSSSLPTEVPRGVNNVLRLDAGSRAILRGLQSTLEELRREGTTGRLDAWKHNYAEQYAKLRELRDFAAWSAHALNPETAAALFHCSSLAARIASALPEEACQQPFNWGPNVAKEQVEDLLIGKFDLQAKIEHACCAARVTGGAVILIGTRNPIETPLPDNPGEVYFLEVLDRRQVHPMHWDQDPASPRFEQPDMYRIRNSVWHYSHMQFFAGARTLAQEKRRNLGWDYSVYQGLEQAILAMQEAWDESRGMLSSRERMVIYIEGLLNAITKHGPEKMQERARAFKQHQDQFGISALDTKEKLESQQKAFTGVGEIVREQMNMLCAYTGVPATKLFGQAPAGLNATGESDLRNWTAQVQAYRLRQAQPAAKRIGSMIVRARVQVSFASLWIETRKEESERYKQTVESDAKLIEWQMITPERVSKHRLVDGNWDSPPRLEESDLSAMRTEPADIEQASGAPAPDATAPAPELPSTLPPIEVTPSDLATVTKVRYVLQSRGIPLFGTPDDDLTVAQFKAKYAVIVATGEAASSGQLAPQDPNAQPAAAPATPDPNAAPAQGAPPANPPPAAA